MKPRPIVVLSDRNGGNPLLDDVLMEMGYLVIRAEKPSDVVVRAADVADVVNAADVEVLHTMASLASSGLPIAPTPEQFARATQLESLAKRLADVLGLEEEEPAHG